MRVPPSVDVAVAERVSGVPPRVAVAGGVKEMVWFALATVMVCSLAGVGM